MGEYILQLVKQLKPDVILLTETKRRRTVDVSTDLSCNPREYRAIQLNSTECHTGGMIVILRRELKVETVELVRVRDGEDFIQGIVIVDKEGGALIHWYSSPTTTNDTFGTTIKRMLKDYEVKVMMGDFNARHTTWCTKHEDKRKGARLIKEDKKVPGYRIHAARQPTFQAKRYRNKGSFGSSNIDLIAAQVKLRDMARIEEQVAEESDHFPVRFTEDWEIAKEATARRIPKTLLQSKQMRKKAGELYKISLRTAAAGLERLLQTPTPELTVTEVEDSYEAALMNIREPWETQVKRGGGEADHMSMRSCFGCGNIKRGCTTGGNGAHRSATRPIIKKHVDGHNSESDN